MIVPKADHDKTIREEMVENRETHKCPECNKENDRISFGVCIGFGTPFDIYKCNECGLGYQVKRR